jgi:hypothetical protein
MYYPTTTLALYVGTYVFVCLEIVEFAPGYSVVPSILYKVFVDKVENYIHNCYVALYVFVHM